MNNLDFIQSTPRNRSLFVVEGDFEKNVLFKLIAKLYPELSIDFDNVWIYRTNIYDLYETIKGYYDTDNWEEEDVDLPFILSDKMGLPKCRKDDFTSIVLVFDYERQDTFYDSNHIKQMQMYFNDSTNAGKLYINYPMVESLYDFEKVFEDKDYRDKLFNSSYRKGSEYKNSVKNKSIAKAINLPEKFYDLLMTKFEFLDTPNLEKCVDEILSLIITKDIRLDIENILKKYLPHSKALQASHQLTSDIEQLEGIKEGISFWGYLRLLFRFIIYANIRKSSYIQGEVYHLSENECIEFFKEIDEQVILEIQNINSNIENGFIWILNTCLFIIPDYNTTLIKL